MKDCEVLLDAVTEAYRFRKVMCHITASPNDENRLLAIFGEQ